MSLKTTITDEVLNEYGEINKMTLGSEDHVKTVNAANSMVDRIVKMQEVENETRRIEAEEERNSIEKQKVESERKQNLIKLGATIGLSLLYVGVNIWTNKDYQRFENGGYTHTTEGGRSSIRNLFGLLDKPKI
jgi:hypothetical protein